MTTDAVEPGATPAEQTKWERAVAASRERAERKAGPGNVTVRHDDAAIAKAAQREKWRRAVKRSKDKAESEGKGKPWYKGGSDD